MMNRSDIRSNYLFNSGIDSIEQADVALLIGANPRYEAAILNTRIRKSIINNELQVGLIGSNVNLTYDYAYLGDSVQIIDDILNDKHDFAKVD